MEKKEFQELYQLWLQGKMTGKEWALFQKAVTDVKNDLVLDGLIEADLNSNEFNSVLSDQELNLAYQRVLEKVDVKPLKLKVNHFFTNAKKWQMAAVASVLIVLSIGLWIYNAGPGTGKSGTNKNSYSANDIAPGGNKATLTLANGKTITLSDAKSGVVIDAGKLSYNDGSPLNDDLTGDVKDELMEINTPKGGQYELTLPDGSKIWLNAASTLKFPKTFSGQPGRTVELSGEAYFEVAKDKLHPFRVKSAGQEVEVLGTHFNVNAYRDEAHIKTTLLEGKVKVNDAAILSPNEEAVVAGGKIKINQVNAQEAVAWKNGEFMFNDEQLGIIMRKIARWYDLEIRYQDENMQTQLFGGTITKFGNVSDVLRMLELTGGVHFKIEGRRIIVNR
ncbi:FecR family protein [Pedobacter africanus]|uniref:FecR family protein n=1 Tax=Pedobacter africanus TaxID=151894 RepID=A0A1W1Z7C4_9SPHI|nr:FecR family protein [Pedobacter africanus]SMC44313.1 FecR family protein [Pedobacter africanus]